MILVVSPNLAVDVTLRVDRLEPGGVQRARSSTRQAGGKGVNVARALGALGEEPLLIGFVGGERGREIERGLDAEGIRHELLSFSGESRTCTIVLTPDGSATVINETGAQIDDVEPLVARFSGWVERSRAVALMGSLPPGLGSDAYVRLLDRARELGLPSLVDTSGRALRDALAARPHIAKPNRGEAEELLGRKLHARADVVEASREIRGLGAEIALVTLGREGFVAADASEAVHCFHSASFDLRLGNPTGAGDSLAAGFLAGTVRGYPLSECARLAAAAAVASLAEGYGRFRARDVRVEAVSVEKLPHSAG